MSDVTLNLTPKTYEYLLQYSLRESPILKQLREETHQLSTARMQISPEQGQLMAFLVELIGAKKTIDIGTFTGYSALVVALALPKEGRVIACDINIPWTDIAKRYWRLAGMEQKIDLHLAPALETLDQLLQQEKNTFDFIFIDADKKNYDVYYEYAIKLLRKNGVIAIDNVLWSGSVADVTVQDQRTCAIRELNAKILQDERVSITMIPISDGLTLARKR